MVKIRLTRAGAKNRPFYRVVVTDSRRARDGRFIEKVGFFDSIVRDDHGCKSIFINLDRIDYWIKNGAIVSDRVYSLIKQYKKYNIS